MPLIKTVQRWTGLTRGGQAVAFSPGGDTLAYARGDSDSGSRSLREVICWHSSGSTRWEHRERGKRIQAIAFSPDGQRLLCAEDGPHVTEFDAATGQLTRRFVAHRDNSVWGVAFAPDGATFVTASWDETVKRWRTADATLLSAWAELGESFESVAFSPDGRAVAAGSGGTLGVWEAATGKLVYKGRGHGANCFSPDGKQLVSGGPGKKRKGEILFFDTQSWKIVGSAVAHVRACNAVAFSPDGRVLATSGDEKQVWLGGPGGGKPHTTLQDHILSEFGVVGLAWSPDGKRLASSDSHGYQQPGQVTVYTFADAG
jgi:WD40 repeat protein